MAPTTQIAIRLDHDVLARLDKLAEAMTQPWRKMSRSDALRFVIDQGLPKAEQVVKPTKQVVKPTKAARRRKR